MDRIGLSTDSSPFRTQGQDEFLLLRSLDRISRERLLFDLSTPVSKEGDPILARSLEIDRSEQLIGRHFDVFSLVSPGKRN